MTQPSKEAMDAVDQGFKDAWLECIETHQATMVSGPCIACMGKHAKAVREKPLAPYQSADRNVLHAPLGVLVGHHCSPPEAWHDQPPESAVSEFQWLWVCPKCSRRFRLTGYGPDYSEATPDWCLYWTVEP